MRVFMIPFQDQSRTFTMEGLSYNQGRLLSEVVTLHTHCRGVIDLNIFFGKDAAVTVLDSHEVPLAAFVASAIDDAELIDFCTLTLPDHYRLKIQRRFRPPHDENDNSPKTKWRTVRAGVPLCSKSMILARGAANTSWFRALVADASHDWRKAA